MSWSPRLLLLAIPLLAGCPSAEPDPITEPEPTPDLEPEGPPDDLVLYTTGDDADADVAPQGPLLLAMGGSAEVDASFVAAFDALGVVGDVVVLRASGSDGYNDYLYEDIGGIDSAQTFLVTTRELADDPWVAWRVRHAEVVWMAGGDQSEYVVNWEGTATADAIRAVAARGGLVGGTSAGAAVLGEIAYSARQGSATSDEVLANPYHSDISLESGFLDLPLGAGLLFDTHFAERDRMGRLVTFLARTIEDDLHPAPLGLGLDERTALLVDADGRAEVYGDGKVHVVTTAGPAQACEDGEPLEYAGLTTTPVARGGVIELPAGSTAGPSTPLSAGGGDLDPDDPYGG